MIGERFICKKCGEKFHEIPTSHGVIFMRFAGRKPKPAEMCDGQIVPINQPEVVE